MAEMCCVSNSGNDVSFRRVRDHIWNLQTKHNVRSIVLMMTRAAFLAAFFLGVFSYGKNLVY